MSTVVITIINTVFWTSLHFGVAWIITAAVPKSFYNPTGFIFRERAFEKQLYKTIRINKWKDKLPQYNVDFNKRQMPKKLTIDYIEQFIVETCRAELIHTAIGLLVFSSAILFVLKVESLRVFVIVAIIIFLLQIPFILIQRYNRPRLIKLIRCRNNN